MRWRPRAMSVADERPIDERSQPGRHLAVGDGQCGAVRDRLRFELPPAARAAHADTRGERTSNVTDCSRLTGAVGLNVVGDVPDTRPACAQTRHRRTEPVVRLHVSERACVVCRRVEDAGEHRGELGPGHGVVRPETAVVVAVDDAGLRELLDCRAEPIPGADVREGQGRGRQREQHDAAAPTDASRAATDPGLRSPLACVPCSPLFLLVAPVPAAEVPRSMYSCYQKTWGTAAVEQAPREAERRTRAVCLQGRERRRPESNRCSGFCRPVPKPLGHVAPRTRAPRHERGPYGPPLAPAGEPRSG